jgi:hypothetical protein
MVALWPGYGRTGFLTLVSHAVLGEAPGATATGSAPTETLSIVRGSEPAAAEEA